MTTPSADDRPPVVLARPPVHPRRLVYFGTPEMAVPPLVALHDAGFEIALVVTGADKRRGRGSETTPTPVKLAALQRAMPVSHDPDDALAPDVDADLGVVVAFGRILRRPLLEALPMVNVHFSLLPRWRGAAPVERAILAGDARTGVCIMEVAEGLDTGAVHARRELAIRRSSTADELGRQLTDLGADLLVDTLEAGLGEPTPQEGETTYAAKLSPQERMLVWSRPAVELDRVVRVGGAWTTFRGRRLKVLEAAVHDEDGSGAPGTLLHGRVTCGTGSLHLRTVQPEGKGPVPYEGWANGARLAGDEILGEVAS